jgi:hypothetical protein
MAQRLALKFCVAGSLILLVSAAGWWIEIPVSHELTTAFSVQRGDGHEYVVALSRFAPRFFTVPSDDTEHPQRSTLAVFEDARPLGPPHAIHAHIRQIGGGAFSHWSSQLRFSASDNSDPRSNGRSYRIEGRARLKPRLLALVSAALAVCVLAGGIAFVNRTRKTASPSPSAVDADHSSEASNPSSPRPAVRRIGPLKQILFSLLISVVFVLGLLFCIELIWRLAAPKPRELLVDVELFPYKHYVITSQPANLVLGRSTSVLEGFFSHGECDLPKGTTATFNSDGFRSPPIRDVAPKEKGEIRVLITGGSVSISWNVGERCTLDNRLRELFAERYPKSKVSIFNLGSGAWKSFQQLIAVQLYGLRLNPDVIVILDGFNDIQHAYSLPIDQPYSNTAEVAFERYRAWVHSDWRDLFLGLRFVSALRSAINPPSVGMAGRTTAEMPLPPAPERALGATPGQLATRLQLPVNELAIGERSDFDPFNQQVVENYLKNEKLLSLAAQTVGAKALFVLQPTLYLKEPLSAKELDLLQSYAPSVNFVVQGYGRMREGLSRIAASDPSCRFLDLSRAFGGDSRGLFLDYAHFNEEGYRIVSNFVFKELEILLELSGKTGTGS